MNFFALRCYRQGILEGGIADVELLKGKELGNMGNGEFYPIALAL